MEDGQSSSGKDARSRQQENEAPGASRHSGAHSHYGGRSLNLSVIGLQSLGSDATSSLILPCPVSSAITIHHFEDCIAVTIPIDSIVKTASLLDIQGSQMLVDRCIDAVNRILQKDPTKFARIMNEEELDIERFTPGYPQEIAANVIRSTLDFLYRHNNQNGNKDNSIPLPTTIGVAVAQPAQPNDSPAEADTIALSVGVVKATSKPNGSETRCYNCGKAGHSKNSCTKPCWSCGQNHSLNGRCPQVGKRCWCEPRPHHLDKNCPKECRFCKISTFHKPHKNPWICPYMCCLCGSPCHKGWSCKIDCLCEDRHLGQDCPSQICIKKGCPWLRCNDHCKRCGVSWNQGSHRCQWKRVVRRGGVYLQCTSNPSHPLIPLEKLWEMREDGVGDNECGACREY